MQNPEAARDIASETFLRAYRAVDSFRIGEISYAGYLFMICRRLMVTEQTRNGSVVAHSLDENPSEMEKLVDGGLPPLELLLSAERRTMLRDALDKLPAGDRGIIQLAFDQDLSRKDIAEILAKPSVSAVTSHLHRAVQRLKAVIIAQGYFDCDREVERKSDHATR
jgi:RNA polymerase sigma-70 factor (ECF subfamily)